MSGFDDHKKASVWSALEWLATRPEDVVAYAKKTLIDLDA